jgi:hypothetical protein
VFPECGHWDNLAVVGLGHDKMFGDERPILQHPCVLHPIRGDPNDVVRHLVLFVLVQRGGDCVPTLGTYRFDASFCQHREPHNQSDAEQSAEHCDVGGSGRQFVEDGSGADDGGGSVLVLDGADVRVAEEAVGPLERARLCDAPVVAGQRPF